MFSALCTSGASVLGKTFDISLLLVCAVIRMNPV